MRAPDEGSYMMRTLNRTAGNHVRAVAARLRCAGGFCDRAQKMFDNPQVMIAYALDDVKFAQETLQPILESLKP